MNLARMVDWFDRLRVISPQRWVLIGVAMTAAVAAPLVTGVVDGNVNGVMVAIVFAAAVGATARPDFHTALAVEAIVVWQWLATVDDPLTPWAMAMAGCVFAFHTTVALMSVAPMTSVIDALVVRRWVKRSVPVVVATLAAWLLVMTLDGRQAPGSAVLTAAAFVTLAGLALAARTVQKCHTPSR